LIDIFINKNIMNKNRFKQLLESKLGNVKPLIFESDPEPQITSVLSSPEKKQEIKSILWNQLNKPENKNLKYSLGLNASNSNEGSFLNTISDKVEINYNPSSKFISFEFPEIGKKINASLSFGFKSNKNNTENETLSSVTPESNFELGVKIPLSKIFGS